ncbi:MAG TPA: type II secretion system protein GspL [Pseudomonas sp.]|nr:type II secretion system protein GspL [Pseudomonas sp.]
MKTWLYLTAEGLDAPSLDWPCCLWPQAGERQTLPLSEAAPMLKGKVVALLLPMESCSWLRTEPWPSGRRPDAKTLAFAVEEQLSQALERLHLSAGRRDPQGRYPLMVMDRARFAGVLALLAQSGVDVRSVFVDADLLPADQALGVRWFGRWVLGGALGARLALGDDALTSLKPCLPADLQWYPDDVDHWLRGDHSQAINLLHGDFALTRTHLPWRFGALAALLLVALTWGACEARIRFLEHEGRQLYSLNEQQFKALYPEQTRIVDLATQFHALQRQGAQAQGSQIAALVKLVEQVIGASPVEVQRIEFRDGDGWKIQLSANNFAELEQLRERGRQQGLPVRLDSASKERNRVQATLTMEQGV